MNIDLRWTLDPDFQGRAWPDVGDRGLAVNGLPMHLFALRVEDDTETRGHPQNAWSTAFEREVNAAQDMNGGRLHSVELPGLEGRWVILAHPHED